MNIFRWLNKIYATWFGYFWSSCLLCGEYVGGHEWRDTTVGVPTDQGTRRGVCSKCSTRLKSGSINYDSRYRYYSHKLGRMIYRK